MREHLAEAITQLRTFLDTQAQVAANTGPDQIDILDLKLPTETLDALAQLSFSPDAIAPTTQIARREAYDFVKSLGRLTDVHQRSRKDYYQKSPAELSVCTAQLSYLEAVLSSLDKHGA